VVSSPSLVFIFSAFAFPLALLGLQILYYILFILDYGGATAFSVVPFMIATTCDIAL